jgi:hypothetical protein
LYHCLIHEGICVRGCPSRLSNPQHMENRDITGLEHCRPVFSRAMPRSQLCPENDAPQNQWEAMGLCFERCSKDLRSFLGRVILRRSKEKGRNGVTGTAQTVGIWWSCLLRRFIRSPAAEWASSMRLRRRFPKMPKVSRCPIRFVHPRVMMSEMSYSVVYSIERDLVWTFEFTGALTSMKLLL